MIEDNDELIGQIADALRPLPQVDDEAKARVLIAVAAERERDRSEVSRRHGIRRRRVWFVGGTGLVAAAAMGILLLRPPTGSAPAFAPVATPIQATVASGASTATRLAGNRAPESAELAAQAIQLVFKAPTATQVRVVGDFNGWDRDRAPMVRDAESGLWSVTLSLRPGRHVYAFVVDDSVWLRDPRAPAAKDTDFGRPGSVLLVGRP